MKYRYSLFLLLLLPFAAYSVTEILIPTQVQPPTISVTPTYPEAKIQADIERIIKSLNALANPKQTINNKNKEKLVNR